MSFRAWFEKLPISRSLDRFQRARRRSPRRSHNSNLCLAAEVLEVRQLLSAVAGVNSSLGIAAGSMAAASTPPLTDAPTQARVSQAYGQMALSFEANQGQTDASVNFLSRGSGHTLFLTPGSVVIDLQQGSGHDTVLRMQLVGANSAAQAAGLDQQASTSNYLVGNDPSQWHTGIANYGRVVYDDVYVGIDLAYYGNQQQLEYDFIVAPGADPNKIRLSFQGAEDVALDAGGNLVLHTAGGDVVEHAPVVYQESGGVRQAVSGRYVLEESGQVRFEVGAYDTTRTLVIDPVFSLSYSTFLGGKGSETGYSIAVDADGNAYVTGSTSSANFPGKNALQAGNGGAEDVFVSKLNAAGTALIYSTYLGGTGNDSGKSLALSTDESGKTFVYVAGFTESTNFPTKNPLYANHGGGTWDAFVAKLNDTGSGLVYSTYLGGSGQDQAQGIAVDADGNAFVAGTTTSTNFPTVNTLYPSGHAGFVAELNAAGSALVYSTYLRGAFATAIAVDGSANAYVTGSTSPTFFSATDGAFQTTVGGSGDAFAMKLLPGGTGLAYATYLGGSATEVGNGIAVDNLGNAYVTGSTTSTNFPTTPGAFQSLISSAGTEAFVTKLNPTGTGVVYSTYLGGSSGADYGYSIAVGSTGNAYVTGATSSNNFPLLNAVQSTYGGGFVAFVTALNTSGSGLVYSSYLGGSSGNNTGYGVAVDGTGNAYVTGMTNSSDFPTKNALQSKFGGPLHTSDAFVTKIAAPAAATAALVVTGFPSSSTAGMAATFTVTARDADGNTLTDYLGTVHLGSSDPTAVLLNAYTFTPADGGAHTFSVTLKTAGSQSLTAADTVTPGMGGAEASILVKPATAARFIISGPSSINAGKQFSVTITVQDAYGNVATGYTGTVRFTSTDSTATLPANYTFKAADNGIHTFTGLKLKKKGQQAISLIDTLFPTITDSLTIAVN